MPKRGVISVMLVSQYHVFAHFLPRGKMQLLLNRTLNHELQKKSHSLGRLVNHHTNGHSQKFILIFWHVSE